MTQIAMNPNKFYEPEWAKSHGLYAEIFTTTASMDEAVQKLTEELCKFNPEAMAEMKKMFWSGTEDWDELLAERAAISGRLVLSEFTKETLKRFK